jgi:hypothetical protein
MEQNGPTGTTKRKQPPTSPSTDRPLKQIKPENGTHAMNGIPRSPGTDDMEEDVQSEYSVDEPLMAPVAAVHDTVRQVPLTLKYF